MDKYNKPYHLVRESEGEFIQGDWVPGEPIKKLLYGHFQPLGAELTQEDGGKYTSDDRLLLARYKHEDDELITYQGVDYIVKERFIREYADIHRFVLKKQLNKRGSGQ